MSGIIIGLQAAKMLMNIGQGISAKNKEKKEKRKAWQLEKDLKQFEASRQAVIDQSGAIRDMKKQVFNPYANLAVANQAAELQIEQTDQALANTLDQINQSGTGAGAATALARMAAASKAQVGASLEKQEVNNQQLRAQGEAKAAETKLRIEESAIRAEGAAWDRQEDRDLVTMDRLAGLGENAQAQAMAYEQQAGQAFGNAASSAVGLGGDIAGLSETESTFDPNELKNFTTPEEVQGYLDKIGQKEFGR